VANDPATPTPPPAPNVPARHVRTFAQDVARLSGKPLPSNAPVAQPSPAPAKTSPVPPVPEAPAEEKPFPQIKKPQVPQAPPPPPPPPKEPPPAYIIPKAPNSTETREAVLARLRARKVPQEEPVAPPTVIPKAPSTNETKEDVLARLRAKAEVTAQESAVRLPAREAPKPVPEREPVFAPVPKKIAPLSPSPEGPDRLHTYKSDFADHAQSNDASAISVLAAQADAGRVDRVLFKEKKSFPFGILAGVLLIFAGVGGVFFAYQSISNKPLVVFAPRIPSLIASDDRREIVGDNFLRDLAVASAEPLAEGRVRITYTTTATTSANGTVSKLPATGGALIKALALPMPDILARSITEESTVGIIHEGDEQAPFFILRVDSFERSFAGMLAWEQRMGNDLALLFPAYPVEVIEEVSTSTAPLEPTIATTFDSEFKDEVIQNRDVRALRDEEGRVVLLYGFRDKETLIITRSTSLYLALIERLNTSRGE
jgi:hypothetical protein